MLFIAMYRLMPLIFPLGILAIALGPLGTALISQYFFDQHPCILCLYQRIPYAVGMILGLVSLSFYKQPSRLALVLFALGATYAVGAGIAVFHVGVEQKLWTFASGCSGAGVDASQSLEAFIAQIKAAPTVRCDQPTWFFMGLTMAAWNVIFSAAVALGALWAGLALRPMGRG
jgi:disulfide bond formation protein DsbB